MSLANLRATNWTASKYKEFVGSLPDLKSHPIADVLSPKARMHSSIACAAST